MELGEFSLDATLEECISIVTTKAAEKALDLQLQARRGGVA